MNQLGNLYDGSLNRSEDAAAFYRRAADKYAEIHDVMREGTARSNLGDTLRRLGRLNKARREIRWAIECKACFGHAAQPWTVWSILSDIETDDGNPAAAAEAKRKAVWCYLAYRRDGGENHFQDGRICLEVTRHLFAGDTAVAELFLGQLAAHPEVPAELRFFIQALQAIVAGSRDRSLADSPGFDCTMAAEILSLIESLKKPR